MDDIRRSINKHSVKELTTWLYNILVQPQSGVGSGIQDEEEEHFQLSLKDIRDALIGVTDLANNLSTLTQGKALDARQGKALKDMINLINLSTVILWQEQALSIDVPASGDSIGDRYLDLNGSKSIKTWDGTKYVNEVPVENWAIFVKDSLIIYVYQNSNWHILGDFGIFGYLHESMVSMLNEEGYLSVVDNMGSILNVGGNIEDINTVVSLSQVITDVSENKTNINAVNSNKANINNVAGNKVNIDNVAGNKVNIDIVAGISSKVSDLADRKDKIDDLYAELPLLEDKLDVSTFEANVDQALLKTSDVQHKSLGLTHNNIQKATIEFDVAEECIVFRIE